MTSYAPASRRWFIKRFLLGVAALSIPGRRWGSPMVLGVEAADPAQPGRVRVSLTEFPSLAQPYGSVRLSPNPVGDDHFPQGELYPILVNRAPDGRFHALSAECSHAGCVVESYDELEQGLRCPCHGSLYGFDGAVIQGPAARSLASYPVAYDGADSLEIQVPGYGFRITPQAAGSRIAPRMRLVFPSEANALYQVIRRTSLSDPGVPVKFSPLEEGAPDISTWIGTGGDQALYVSTAGAGGFFEVVMLLAEQ